MRLRRLGAVAAGVALVAVASPAAAHPLGPPPQVTVAAEGRTVTLTWTAQPDDLYAIALSLGAVAGEMVFEEVDGRMVQVGGDSDPAVLAADPSVPTYFLEHLQVAQDERPCEAELQERPTYAGGAALLTYQCPGNVSMAEVTVTALSDISPAYRTIVRAAGAAPDQGLHTADNPTQAYAFTATVAATGGAASSRKAVIVTGAGLLVLAGGAFARQLRRRAA